MARSGRQIDDGMLEKLLLARAGRLRGYVEKKIPPKLRSTISPEDVLQEVWIGAFRGISGFRSDGPEAFDRWLATITNRRLLDVMKVALARKRGGRSPFTSERHNRQTSVFDLFARVASPQTSPSRVNATREAVDAVQIALAALPDDRRRAIWMHHIEGCGIAEIAATMEKSRAAVASLLFHGRRQLRDRLGSAAKYFSDAGRSEDASP